MFYPIHGTDQIVLLVGAAAVGWFIHNLFSWLTVSNPWKKFKFKLSTTEQYWRVSIVFLFFSLVAAFVIWVYSDIHTRTANLSLLVECLTLLFALYAGYFAFKQMNLARFDGIATQAHTLFCTNDDPKKAIKEYELAASIKLDFSLVSEQIECYAYLSDWDNYEKYIALLPNIQMTDEDTLLIFYLKSLRPFLSEEVQRMKAVFQEVVLFKKTLKKKARIGWRMTEIKKSESYTQLDATTKELYAKFFDYLTESLIPEQREVFEQTYS